jgi:hypothetical protein
MERQRARIMLRPRGGARRHGRQATHHAHPTPPHPAETTGEPKPPTLPIKNKQSKKARTPSPLPLPVRLPVSRARGSGSCPPARPPPFATTTTTRHPGGRALAAAGLGWARHAVRRPPLSPSAWRTPDVAGGVRRQRLSVGTSLCLPRVLGLGGGVASRPPLRRAWSSMPPAPKGAYTPGRHLSWRATWAPFACRPARQWRALAPGRALPWHVADAGMLRHPELPYVAGVLTGLVVVVVLMAEQLDIIFFFPLPSASSLATLRHGYSKKIGRASSTIYRCFLSRSLVSRRHHEIDFERTRKMDLWT